ncbi:MAG: hypothetical protein WBG41_08440 [Acidimicrobiales bacterium]
MLVDGGVLANLPVSQAIELGATRVYVLPAMADGVGSLPSGAIDMMQRSMMIATAALAKRDLDEARGCAEVHILPVPTAAQLSMFDFGETRYLPLQPRLRPARAGSRELPPGPDGPSACGPCSSSRPGEFDPGCRPGASRNRPHGLRHGPVPTP